MAPADELHNSIRRAKADLRREVAIRVGAASKTARAEWDRAISESLLESALYWDCEQLVAYSPLPDEVSLLILTDEAQRVGKRVYLPVVGRRGDLSFHLYQKGARLNRGRCGTLEPIVSEGPAGRLSTTEGALVLVPGRAFDREGRRLGRGGGHYDRIASLLKTNGTLIGVAYELQVLPAVPVEGHDFYVDGVVTEVGVAMCV